MQQRIKGNRTHLKRHEEYTIHTNYNLSQKQNMVPIDKVIKKINLKNNLLVKISLLNLLCKNFLFFVTIIFAVFLFIFYIS